MAWLKHRKPALKSLTINSNIEDIFSDVAADDL